MLYVLLHVTIIITYKRVNFVPFLYYLYLYLVILSNGKLVFDTIKTLFFHHKGLVLQLLL